MLSLDSGTLLIVHTKERKDENNKKSRPDLFDRLGSWAPCVWGGYLREPMGKLERVSWDGRGNYRSSGSFFYSLQISIFFMFFWVLTRSGVLTMKGGETGKGD